MHTPYSLGKSSQIWAVNDVWYDMPPLFQIDHDCVQSENRLQVYKLINVIQLLQIYFK